MRNIHLVTKQIFFWVTSQLKKRKEPRKQVSFVRKQRSGRGSRGSGLPARGSRVHTHLLVGAALGSAAWGMTVARETALGEFHEDFRAAPRTRCVGARPSWCLVGGPRVVSSTVSLTSREVSPPWKLQVGEATSSPLTTRQHRTRHRAPANAQVS